ncbi:hypothetical protein EJB05_01074, partial [Eragrostis curvula]
MDDGVRRLGEREAMDALGKSGPSVTGVEGQSVGAGEQEQEKNVAEVCYVPVTAAMVEAERELEQVLLGKIAEGTWFVVPDDVSRAISIQFGISPTQIKVCRFNANDFLVKLASVDLANKVASKGVVSSRCFKIAVKKWTRFEESDVSPLKWKVEIKVDGIPAHGWQENNVRLSVSRYCWIQKIDMAKFLDGDMSSVRVTAWTADMSKIPSMCYLGISEPQNGGSLRVVEDVISAGFVKLVRQHPIKLTVREIQYPRWIGREGDSGDGPGSDSDSAPSGAYDYNFPSEHGSLEAEYDHDSGREPAAWK